MPHAKYNRITRSAIYPISASIAYIPLTRGAYSRVHADDAPALTYFNWQLYQPKGRSPYAITSIWGGGRKFTIWMHRAVAGIEMPEVDHKDGDGLNNERRNLRPCTGDKNKKNTGLRKNNKSGYKGVFELGPKRWVSYITCKSNRLHLGVFDTPEKAYAAYCEAAQRLHGEFARLG